ncbi:MAG: serine/threonine-protein kinase [Acidobacteriota bacterium]
MRVCPTCRSRFPPGSSFCPYDGQRLEDLNEQADQHDEFIGLVLDDRYRIEGRLGRGGMGVVYAARHVVIDKPVAIKILRKEYSSDPHQVERFVREARAASRIGHPNIVDVTDFGTLFNGQIFLVMEYLAGVTLSRELKTEGALSARRSIAIAVQICRALAAAHAKGIVHRDLKPENVFLLNPSTAAEPDNASGHHPDTVKLLDFGIAKITWDEEGRRLTKVGSVFGTPQYMSPEQASGKDADHRGDIYALGCIVYEMLTGEVPFLADTFMGTLTKQMFEKPVPPRQLRPDLTIPPPLERVILKAMEKNADERFQSMAEMATALLECEADLEPLPEPASSYPDLLPQIVVPVPTSGAASLMEPSTPTVAERPSQLGRSAAHPVVDAAAEPAAPRVVPREPPPRRSRGLAIAIVASIAIVLSGVGVAVLRQRGGGPREGSGSAPAADARAGGAPRRADARVAGTARDLATAATRTHDGGVLAMPDLKKRPVVKRKPKRWDAGAAKRDPKRDPRLFELKPFPKDAR